MVFQMYERLVDYAQQFERSEEFRNAMKSQKWPKNVRNQHPQHQKRKPTNPYMDPLPSAWDPFERTVEQNLKEAETPADLNDVGLFKKHRKIVLDYLAPQYQRIAADSDFIYVLAKEKKAEGGILGEGGRGWSRIDLYQAAEAVDALHD